MSSERARPLRLHRRQLVGGSLEEVFAFFKDPYNLESITPPWLRFRIIEATDREVREGTGIRYRLRLRGVPFRWESRIAEFTPGVSFADEQVTGPYARWYHRHLFHRTAEGVVIEDLVEYRMPFGALGRLVHTLVVRKELARIFDHRAAEMRRRFPLSAAVSGPTASSDRR
jgi:ligand-binding SRPBCC domain-containing protein